MSGRAAFRAAALGALAAVAAIAGLAACDGYRLVEPVSDVTFFSAFVQVTHDDSARYVLRAFFQRARETNVRDDAILVEGARVEPRGTDRADLVQYEWRETRPASDPRSGVLVVRGPVMADGAVALVPVPLVARDPAGPVAPPPGEDLRLRVLSTAPPESLQPESAGWTLNVQPTCAGAGDVAYFYLSVNGPVPSEVHVPRGLLPEPLPSPLEACLTSFGSYSVGPAPYRTFAGTSARLVWRLMP